MSPIGNDIGGRQSASREPDAEFGDQHVHRLTGHLSIAKLTFIETYILWRQPYVGEIRMFGGNFAPAGWNFCDGSLLSIAENETLFTLVGTTYGGDGESTFGVPDLRGRAPIHHRARSGRIAELCHWRVGRRGVRNHYVSADACAFAFVGGDRQLPPIRSREQSGLPSRDALASSVYQLATLLMHP